MKRWTIFFLLSLLIFSCRKDPEPDREVFSEDQVYPYQVIESLAQEGDNLTLQDIPGYQEPMDLLLYFLPLLHEQGIITLDLHFIPREKTEIFNQLIQANLFKETEVREELKSISAYLLQDRYLDFFKGIQHFNSTLNEGEAPFRLASSEEGRLFVFTQSGKAENTPVLRIAGPGSFPVSQEQSQELLDRIRQGYRNHVVRFEEEQDFWIILKDPSGFTPSEPLLDGLVKEDIPAVLKDFPDVGIEQPAFLVLWVLRGKLKQDYRMRTKELQ